MQWGESVEEKPAPATEEMSDAEEAGGEPVAEELAPAAARSTPSTNEGCMHPLETPELRKRRLAGEPPPRLDGAGRSDGGAVRQGRQRGAEAPGGAGNRAAGGGGESGAVTATGDGGPLASGAGSGGIATGMQPPARAAERADEARADEFLERLRADAETPTASGVAARAARPGGTASCVPREPDASSGSAGDGSAGGEAAPVPGPDSVGACGGSGVAGASRVWLQPLWQTEQPAPEDATAAETAPGGEAPPKKPRKRARGAARRATRGRRRHGRQATTCRMRLGTWCPLLRRLEPA